MLLVDFSFGNHRAALADRSIFSRDFFLRAYPFTGLVEVHGAGDNLVIRRFHKLSFGKDQMDIIFGLCLVVVECRSTFHAVLPFEFFGELFQYLIGIIPDKIFRQGDNQFLCLDTFSLKTITLKLLPAFPCKARFMEDLLHIYDEGHTNVKIGDLLGIKQETTRRLPEKDTS